MQIENTAKTEVSEVQIIPVRPVDGLVAFATCLLDGKYFLGSIGIYTKLKGGFRITFPTKKFGSGSCSIFNPITAESCMAITEAVTIKAAQILQFN